MIPCQETFGVRIKIVDRLVKKYPGLCDNSGVGFWPVPLFMPAIYAKCIYLLQYEFTKEIFSNNYVKGEFIGKLRSCLTELAVEGNLGKDCVSVYIDDHHPVQAIDVQDGIFYNLYKDKVLAVSNPFKILGFIYSAGIEWHQLIEQLVDCNIIIDGEYSKLQLEQAPTYEDIIPAIHDLVMKESVNSNYRSNFVRGTELYDELCEQIGQ